MKLKSKQLKQFKAGCGLRVKGGTYLVSDMQKYLEKYPFTYFLFDPPIVINPAEWGVAPIGVSYIFNDGYWHILDWVGESHYPNPSDILEEAFLHNGSALVPLENEMEKLTPGKSRRLLIHAKGYVTNSSIIKKQKMELENIQDCFLQEKDYRRSMHLDKNDDSMCASLHWQNVTGSKAKERGLILRNIGDTTYTAVSPDPNWQLEYLPAIIGWLPIDEIHLVEDTDQQSMNKAIDFLQKFSNLPVYLTNV